jgi:hypothetical protein
MMVLLSDGSEDGANVAKQATELCSHLDELPIHKTMEQEYTA